MDTTCFQHRWKVSACDAILGEPNVIELAEARNNVKFLSTELCNLRLELAEAHRLLQVFTTAEADESVSS